MTITRADVADLRAGDVVELGDEDWCGAVMRGPLIEDYDGALILGIGSRQKPTRFTVRHPDGRPGWASYRTLTVVSRAKPPLYVNSDKTEPDPGDVVRVEFDNASYADDWCVNAYLPGNSSNGRPWLSLGHADPGMRYRGDQIIPSIGTGHLRLLVDGRTGQVVP